MWVCFVRFHRKNTSTTWDLDAGLKDERAVNVHIRRLREKIELDPSNPKIMLSHLI